MNLFSSHLSRLVTSRCRACGRYVSTKSAINFNGGKQVNKIKTENLNQFDHRLSDTFGTLGTNEHRFKKLAAEELEDDDDNYDVLHIKRGPSMAEIGYKIELGKLIKRKPIQLTKALEMYNKMVSEDRIAPSTPTYTLMISGCAKVGYTAKAFEFFDEMINYKMKPSKPCITSLFNACAESPFKKLGLEKANYLQEWMRLEGYEPNTLNYHSMIKAFGKLGQFDTAFKLLEEMARKGHVFDDYTFSMLMMACISDKSCGLFSAIKVVRQFVSKGMPMSIDIFNLLLRSIRDCGIGSEHNLDSLLDSENVSRSQPISTSKAKLFQKVDTSSKENALVPTTPNLLLATLNRKIIKVDFKTLVKPYNRLMLLGGLEGFIKMMLDFDVNPNIKTLTLLTEVIDLNEVSEQEILKLLDKFKIKADTDFFNVLIKQICIRKGLMPAKQILFQMNAKGLQPNIMTFGVLALGCIRTEFGTKLLQDMEAIGMVANIEIMGALMRNACKNYNVIYINYLLDYMQRNGIKADQRMVEQLQKVNVELQTMVAAYERKSNCDIANNFKSDKFKENFSQFKSNFNDLLRKSIEETDHPWKQFQFEELPNKKQMHSFVKFMKTKIKKRRAIRDDLIGEFEEDELYEE